MNKIKVLKELEEWEPHRFSVFVDGKRFPLAKAISYIRNNVSDKSELIVQHTSRKLPWWVGNVRDSISQEYSHKGLYRRIKRENIRITIIAVAHDTNQCIKL